MLKTCFWTIVTSLILFSCASQVHVDPMQITDVTSGYSDTDLRLLAEKMTRSLVEMDFLARAGRRVKIAILDIYNKTSEHIDTKSISDKIMVTLLKSGNVSWTITDALEVAQRWAEEGLDGSFFFYRAWHNTDLEHIIWHLRMMDHPDVEIVP